MAEEHTETQAPYTAFLESESVVLQTKDSKRQFRIHKDLLALKAKAIHVAFEKNFKEKNESRFVFQDTGDDTVVRFLEWTYTGDYSADTHFEGCVEPWSEAGKAGKSSIQEDGTESEDSFDVALRKKRMKHFPEVTEGLAEVHHPQLCHLMAYIFGETWGILPLKSLSYGKLTANIADIGQPEDLNTQLAVIDLLQMAFTNLPQSDGLLDWLGQYAAWCITQLRLQQEFEALMDLVGPAMLPHLNGASYSPWESYSSSKILSKRRGKR